MNERIKKLFEQVADNLDPEDCMVSEEFLESFAELIVQDCIDKIETYRIPVGNSASGELACEWTYDALKEIRNDIQEHFGVKE